MNLKILLPFQVFADLPRVVRIVAETRDGSFGLLPHRLDCVAALIPGILIYETTGEGERYVAIDAGVLIKTGDAVLVSVHRAMAGANLVDMRSAVERQFMITDLAENDLSSVMTKLESGLISRMASFGNE